MNTTTKPLKNEKPPGVIGTMRSKMRLRHMSLFTEKTYIRWVRHFLNFHNQISPRALDGNNIEQYLIFLALQRKVSASTQNQALNAIVFLFKEVLYKDIGELSNIFWAKRAKFLPVVLSVKEVKEVLKNLKGVQRLIGCLLYGTGMRLTEALRLRVKDIDFQRNMILVRDAKDLSFG